MAKQPEQKRLKLEREQWRRKCRTDLVAFAVEALAPAGQNPAGPSPSHLQISQETH
jgi:hypothetical protein